MKSETAIKNRELSALVKKVHHLADEDQKALVIVLDSWSKGQVNKVMSEL